MNDFIIKVMVKCSVAYFMEHKPHHPGIWVMLDENGKIIDDDDNVVDTNHILYGLYHNQYQVIDNPFDERKSNW